MTEIIEDRLNLREGAKVLEKDNLEEAALWCFQHDIFPIGLWLDGASSPDYREKYSILFPIFTDYLNLILRCSGKSLISGYESIFEKLAEKIGDLQRDSDGEVTKSGIEEYYGRFISKRRRENDREYELSVFPYKKFEIDREEIILNTPSSIEDERCIYVANLFREYFPETCALSRSITYSSYEESAYKNHINALHISVRSFIYCNQFSLSIEKGRLDDALQMLAIWVVTIIGPSVRLEEI